MSPSSSDEEYDPLIGPSFRFLANEDEWSDNTSGSSTSEDSFVIDDCCLICEGETTLFQPTTTMDSSSDDDIMGTEATSSSTEETSDFEFCPAASSTPIHQFSDLTESPDLILYSTEEKTPEMIRDASSSILEGQGSLVSTISVIINPFVPSSPTLSQAFLRSLIEAEEQVAVYGTHQNISTLDYSWSAQEDSNNYNIGNSFNNTGTEASTSSSVDENLLCYESIPPSP